MLSTPVSVFSILRKDRIIEFEVTKQTLVPSFHSVYAWRWRLHSKTLSVLSFLKWDLLPSYSENFGTRIVVMYLRRKLFVSETGTGSDSIRLLFPGTCQDYSSCCENSRCKHFRWKDNYHWTVEYRLDVCHATNGKTLKST